MSEVKRFTGDLMYGKPVESRDGVFVYAAVFDRVTAENSALQARLTAADERVDVLEGQIVSAYETAARWVEKRSDDYVNEHGSSDPETGSIELPGTGEEYVCELLDIAEGLRALKPAEGRGEPNCLLCLDKKTVPSNLAEGYVMDCPDCCVEEG